MDLDFSGTGEVERMYKKMGKYSYDPIWLEHNLHDCP